MKNLYIVGSGIKTLSHFTKEFETYTTQSDIVFYLNNDPVTKQWYQKYAKKSYDLDNIYQKDNRTHRSNIYHAIADYVISEFQSYDNICFALYGHPFFCAQPALHAIEKIVRDREDIKIHSFPAVSALDCLWIDLKVNPAEKGMQLYEASFMIHREIPLLSHVDLVVLQAGLIDIDTIYTGKEESSINKLKDYLLKFYSHDHPLVIYEAAQFPSHQPKIISCSVGKLVKDDISTLSTLYITAKR
ncbi:MAG: SAM-dependent methyltransferase [Candidatus Lariskella arthropodorum]